MNPWRANPLPVLIIVVMCAIYWPLGATLLILFLVSEFWYPLLKEICRGVATSKRPPKPKPPEVPSLNPHEQRKRDEFLAAAAEYERVARENPHHWRLPHVEALRRRRLRDRAYREMMRRY